MQSCACGLRIEERGCGRLGQLACGPGCERQPVSVQGLPSRPQKYYGDLVQLASQQRRFVRMLEDACATCLLQQRPQRLPALEPFRRRLALDYVRLHWRLRTSCKATDGWAPLQLEPDRQAAVPRPLLSTMEPGTDRGLTERGGQPRLRFLDAHAEEIYDLVDGTVGVRQSGETVCAYFATGAQAAAAFKQLTGQDKSTEPVPVQMRTRIQVSLETLATRRAASPKPAQALPETKKEEPIVECWEDFSP